MQKHHKRVKYFSSGRAGQTISIGCWIQRSTQHRILMKIIQADKQSIVILILGAMLFSCNKRLDKLQQSSKLSYLPVSIAKNINTSTMILDD